MTCLYCNQCGDYIARFLCVCEGTLLPSVYTGMDPYYKSNPDTYFWFAAVSKPWRGLWRSLALSITLIAEHKLHAEIAILNYVTHTYTVRCLQSHLTGSPLLHVRGTNHYACRLS